jgi:riboflavin synthase
VVTVFTGLVSDVGEVEEVTNTGEGARLRVSTSLGAEIDAGDSVAVNGVCLTATESNEDAFEAEVMNETLRVTSLGPLRRGDRVNLELPLRAADRLGGHLVQGHADGTAEVASVAEDGFARRLRVTLEPGLLRYAVERGSVALDGVSLTVAAVGEGWLEVSLVPETLQRTNLGEAQPGRKLNVECDVVAKYVERLVSPFAGKEDN